MTEAFLQTFSRNADEKIDTTLTSGKYEAGATTGLIKHKETGGLFVGGDR